MASSDPRIVSVNELRFRPANSNDRARAGMQHAFKDVPQCAFAKDDGISPYLGADAGIDGFPDNPATQKALHDDVPDVAQDGAAPALSFGHKLLRSGFGLSVFLHGLFAIGIGYATITLPIDDALLEGETVIAIEFFSETDSEVTTRVKQEEQDGKEEAVETPVEQPKEEPKKDVIEPEKPVEEPRPVEQAKLPEPVEKPVEKPVEEPMEQPVVTDQPEVLSTTEPSSFQIEAAARQILEDTRIEPLPDTPPPMFFTPVEEEKPEPEKKQAQPLTHPVSKPRVVQKVAEIKPVEKPVEKPVVKKEEPKPVEKKPEPKKEQPKKKEEAKKPAPKPEKKKERKKTKARDGNAEADSNKGSSKADKKNGNSQDASQGNSKKKVKGNASTSNYKGLVQRKLERAKKRVRVAAKGTVVVSFAISANGGVVNLRVRKSSGKPAIDQGALDIVRRASPFPATPEGSSLNFSVPMTFKGN